MCLFLCANLNALQRMQPPVDRSLRSSLALCVWHEDDPLELDHIEIGEQISHYAMGRRETLPDRSARRPNLSDHIQLRATGAIHRPTGSFSEEKVPKSLSDALARLFRWLGGG
jgi:hypothetical protein